MGHGGSLDNIFQSTLPVRGVTLLLSSLPRTELFQSTLPVRGVTDILSEGYASLFEFQSTLPVRGVTVLTVITVLPPIQFQSTLPVRGVTTAETRQGRHSAISIHTPREGSDITACMFSMVYCNFNPHSP